MRQMLNLCAAIPFTPYTKGFEYGFLTLPEATGWELRRDGTGGKEERRHGISLFFQYPHREGEKGCAEGYFPISVREWISITR